VLDVRPAVDHWKAHGLDLAPVLFVPDLPEGAARRGVREQDHGLDKALDNKLIELAGPALNGGDKVAEELAVRNDQRSVGAMLGGEVTRRFGGAGLPDDTITFTLRGTGGQSFGAFLPRGVTLRLIGDTNDYVAKGLSGGRVIVRPDDAAPFVAEENIIAGNTILYGATGGELFLRGRAGERFGVRNSGGAAVVEGVGDHGCEYMTGGTVIVLGPTGRNFAAGMSGGTAFVLDLVPTRVNPELVDLAPLTADEQSTLRGLVGKHLAETGSAVADKLLADWPAAVGRFTAVVPRDYKRVMELIRTAEAAGRNVDEAVMGVKSA
jgi:glutamate synthase (NADPH/NADH) large chain